ncbi:F-Bar And Double Sh3 Domains Protein 1 [Manis pentadactyla]|nr:F-Bar And Double Sh3 Domains Protein 1 [Manis pentadactyla]
MCQIPLSCNANQVLFPLLGCLLGTWQCQGSVVLIWTERWWLTAVQSSDWSHGLHCPVGFIPTRFAKLCRSSGPPSKKSKELPWGGSPPFLPGGLTAPPASAGHGTGHNLQAFSISSSLARRELATSAKPALDAPVKTEPWERRMGSWQTWSNHAILSSGAGLRSSLGIA